MRETGPVAKRYTPGGEKYITQARTFLAEMKARLAKGVKSGWWHRVLVDGTEILVMTSYGRDRFYITTGAVGERVVYVFYGLESGLILFSTQTSITGAVQVINTDFPLPVYLGEDLTDYVNSAGDLLPNYGEERYLFWGDRAGDPVGDCLAWPIDFPIGTENEYTSINFIELGALTQSLGHVVDPVWYTGKTRLAAQAKLQGGKSINELAPDSWQEQVRVGIFCNLGISDGIFHDGDYHYWLIRPNSAGCFAVKLDLPTEYADAECLRTMLQSGLLDTDTTTRIEAYLLSLLEPVADTQITVLTAEDIEDVYSEGKAPLYHGWHFSRQIDTVLAAYIVTLHTSPDATTNNYFARSYVYKLTFTVTSELVTASLDERVDLGSGKDLYPIPFSDRIFTPDPTGVSSLPVWWNSQIEDYEVKGDSTPFYCFYDKDDQIEICTYDYDYQPGFETFVETGVPNSSCAPGSWFSEGWRNVTITAFEFRQQEEANIRMGSKNTDGTDYHATLKVDWRWTTGQTVDCGCLNGAGIPCTTVDPDCYDNDNYFAFERAVDCNPGLSLRTNECYAVEITGGTASANKDRNVLYGVESKKYFFITDDAEAVYAVNYFEYTSSSSRKLEVGNNPTAVLVGKWTNIDNYPGEVVGPAPLAITIGPSSIGSDCIDYNGSAQTGSWVGPTVNGAGEDAYAYLVTSQGTTQLDKTTPSDWDVTISKEFPYYPISMPAQVSYVHGDTSYRNSPNELLVSGDYQAEINKLIASSKRFIGFA